MAKTAPQNNAEIFYTSVLKTLIDNKCALLVAGTYAFREYTKIHRDTKDLDLFCKPGDYPKMLEILQKNGFKTEITDARWIAKVKNKNRRDYVDLIFGSASGVCPVDDTWFQYAVPISLFDLKLQAISPEDFLWSKTYVQDRARYEGPDVNHMILKQGRTMDWKRLLARMDGHWEILFAHILNFRFIYPSEREIIPRWLMDELVLRLNQQFSIPIPKDKICRGTMLSRFQYEIDVKEWGFKDVT